MALPSRPALKATARLAAFLALTLPLMPVQALLKRLARPRASTRPRSHTGGEDKPPVPWHAAFPHWYHRQVCRLLGIHVHVDGNVARDGPVLLISNHISWLDIIVLSAVAPLSFIAKREVAGWPLAGTLARLQRTIFIDRTQRSDVGRANAEISERLGGNERVVLFAEGTSSDGTTVLAFNTALFAAAKPSAKPHAAADHQVQAHDVPPLRAIKVQTLAITYTHLDGLPLNRLERPRLAWYGDMSMGGHAWGILKAGRIDVRVIVGEAADLASFPDRKALAARTEADIRRAVVAALRPHGQAPPPEPVTPSRRRDHAFKARSQSTSRTMT